LPADVDIEGAVERAEAAKARPSGSQSKTGYSRTAPTSEEEIASAAGRARRRVGAIDRGKGARPRYANDPVKPKGRASAGSKKRPGSATVAKVSRSRQTGGLDPRVQPGQAPTATHDVAPAQVVKGAQGASGPGVVADPISIGPNPRPGTAAPPRFEPGARVAHLQFGDGTVITTREGKVTVAFDTGGEKVVIGDRLAPTGTPTAVSTVAGTASPAPTSGSTKVPAPPQPRTLSQPVRSRPSANTPTTIVFRKDWARITGDEAAFRASQQGYHVYEYLDENGDLLYTGISGGVREKNKKRIQNLPPGESEPPVNNWINRLQNEHRYTPWIGRARHIRVTYHLTYQEYLSLEEVLIPTGEANIKRGDYSSKTRGEDPSVGAASAVKSGAPQAVFGFEAHSVRGSR
jgi:hypothetical protein